VLLADNYKNIVQLTEMKPIIAALMLAILLSVTACETAPPVQEMSDARQAIAVAKEAGAEERAAVHLQAAESYLERAEQQLNEHNYYEARRDAKQAKIKALDALKASEAAAKDTPQ